MKKLAMIATVGLAACSSGRKTDTIGSSGGSSHAPVLVYFDWGMESVFEAACWAPDAAGCDALRAKAAAGGELAAGGATFRMTGVRPEECGASGDVAEVMGYTRVSGPEDASPGITSFPADVDIGLARHETRDGEGAEPWMTEALVQRATKDVAGTDRQRVIAAGDITVTQAVKGNFAGGKGDDYLIGASVALVEDQGPGYVWSALVLVVDGDRSAPITLTQSDLEHFAIPATFDLDGDGVREFLWTADYYEGASMGAGKIVDGKLEQLSQVGCGA